MESYRGYSSIFDNPAVYEIALYGRLGQDELLGAEELSMKYKTLDDGSKVTYLICRLADQAALIGVLYCIYERHLPIISVKRMSELQ